MGKKWQKISPAWLRWQSFRLIDKTGKRPLFAALLPLLLAGYWLVWLAPQNARQQNELEAMQQQLKEPLPVVAEKDEPALQTALSITEYQQVKMLFTIFSRHHLQVEGSSYQFPVSEGREEKGLKLSVPLHGNWASLAQALQDITRVLPVSVERLDIKREQVTATQLSIRLQLTLRRGQV